MITPSSSRVVGVLAELAEHPVAAVEQDLRPVGLDQIAAAGPSGVLPGRRLAEDGDSQGEGPIAPPGLITALLPGFATQPRLHAAAPPKSLRASPYAPTASGRAAASGARPARSRISSAGWRGGTRPSGVSGRKVGQGESNPRAQRPRRRKKQSSQLTAALRARPSAKVRPHPLLVSFSPGSRDPASVSGRRVPAPRDRGPSWHLRRRASGTTSQMALFFFHRLVTTFASTEKHRPSNCSR